MNTPNDELHNERDDMGDAPSQWFINAISAPFSIALILVAKFASVLRPFSSQVIPLLVCLFLIPLLLLLSASAGWAVWNSAAVNWEAPLYLQYGDGVPPYAQAALPRLIPQHRYDITLDLAVPATETNIVLGNFMTTLTLLSSSNKTLITIRRPAIALAPPSSMLFKSSKMIDIHLPMLSSFVPGTSWVNANVEIGRKDGWTSLGSGEGREISVVSAFIRGTAVHHGIRGFISRHPLTSAIVASVSFLGILVLILGASLLPIMLRDSEQKQIKYEPLESPVSSEEMVGSELEENPAKRRKRARTTRSVSQRMGIKAETPTSPIPSASTPVTPLRRRTSRLLESSESDQ